MAIEKLSEFAKDGQKNTDDLVLTDGFSVSRKPARQWFNWLFNTLTLKINEVIELDPVARSEIVDDLTTNDSNKPISAKQAKVLQDNKLDKSDLEDASTTQKGIVQLNNTLTSSATDEALTAAQGKVLGGSLDILDYCPIAYPKSTPPAGYLAMMGQTISQETYPKLYGLYGAVLPDLRAYTIRGLDNGRGVDVGRIILSEQGDAIREITGYFGQHVNSYVGGVFLRKQQASNCENIGVGGGWSTNSVEFKASNVVPTAPENRIKNIAFLYIVKAG